MESISKRDGPTPPGAPGSRHDRMTNTAEHPRERRDYAAGADGEQDVDVEAAGRGASGDRLVPDASRDTPPKPAQ